MEWTRLFCRIPSHNETKALKDPCEPVAHYNLFYHRFFSCPGLYMLSTICNSINSSPSRRTLSCCQQDLQVTRARRPPSTCTGTSTMPSSSPGPQLEQPVEHAAALCAQGLLPLRHVSQSPPPLPPSAPLRSPFPHALPSLPPSRSFCCSPSFRS